MYTVLLLDSDGCELSNSEEDTLTGAKALARDRVRDPEYAHSGAHKAEVRNSRNECVYDCFATSGFVYASTNYSAG